MSRSRQIPVIAAHSSSFATQPDGIAVHQKEHARAIRHGRLQRLEIESPSSPIAAKGNEPRNGAHEPDALKHSRVRGVREDDFVARIRQSEKGVQHGGAVAVRDDDLAVGVIQRAAATGNQVGDRLLHLVEPGER
jgi:hypothetical protein